MKSQRHSTRQPNGSCTGSSSLSPETSLVRGELLPARGAIDFRAVRDAVSITQVLELIDWMPVTQSGPQLRGPCPIHKSSHERSRSFSVNVAANVFQCFGCGEKGNQLDLWTALSGLPLYEAALDLVRRLQIDASQVFKIGDKRK